MSKIGQFVGGIGVDTLDLHVDLDGESHPAVSESEVHSCSGGGGATRDFVFVGHELKSPVEARRVTSSEKLLWVGCGALITITRNQVHMDNVGIRYAVKSVHGGE